MSKGGGGGGQTQFNWNDSLKPYWEGDLARANTASQQPYQQYQGQRIAGIDDPDTQAAMDRVRQLSTQGTPEANAARISLQDTLQGNYGNPWADQQTKPGENQYSGFNPFFQQQYQQGLQDISQTYKDTTAPQTDAAFVMNGTMGGGDWQRAVERNQAALSKGLGQYATGMFGQQFDRSGQMQEAALGRDLNAQEFDKGQGSQAWDAERQRQMGAIPLGMQSEQGQFGNANAVLGLGDIWRQNQQGNLNVGYQNWQDALNQPRNNISWLSGILSGAQGGLPPNQSTTQSGYNASPFSSVLGGALGAYGMFRQ